MPLYDIRDGERNELRGGSVGFADESPDDSLTFVPDDGYDPRQQIEDDAMEVELVMEAASRLMLAVPSERRSAVWPDLLAVCGPRIDRDKLLVRVKAAMWVAEGMDNAPRTVDQILADIAAA